MLYEVAILEKPTKEQAEAGQVEKLILGPTAVVATNERNAALAAALDHVGDFEQVARERMEVYVRPFVQ